MARFINLDLGRKESDGRIVHDIGPRWINVDCIQEFGGFVDKEGFSWIGISFYDSYVVTNCTPQELAEKIEARRAEDK